MTVGAFGDMLKTAISVSGLKGASIAGHINYDPSYISKWINSDVLPSDKTIKSICKGLGDCFAENLSEKELQNFSQEMGITPPVDKEIYKLLYAAYLSDRKNKNITEEAGPAIPLRPFAAGRKQFLFNSLSDYRKKSDTLNMIIMGDLLYCDIEDIVFLMDLKTHVNSLGFANGKIDILISELSIEAYQDARSMVAMLNFLMLPCTVNTNVYRSKITHTGIVFIIEEVLLYTMQCNSSIHWLFETRELDSERIHEIFQTVKTELLPIARKIFVKQNPCAMANPENFEHIFSIRKEWMLLGSMDILFLPIDILENLISMDKSMPAEIKSYWLKKHEINLEYVAAGRQTRCIVYREALEKLIYNGTIRMFDKETILPIPLRLAYIQNIIKNLDQNPALEILIVDDYLVDEIKHKPLPNAFLSRGNAYFLTFPVNGVSEYCFIQDQKFKAALRKMFEQLWKGKNISLFDARDVMGEYLDLCHDITYL